MKLYISVILCMCLSLLSCASLSVVVEHEPGNGYEEYPAESFPSWITKQSIKNMGMKEAIEKRVDESGKFLSADMEQAEPPDWFYSKYTVTKIEIDARNIFIIEGLVPEKTDINVLYLHGGAYSGNFQATNWDFVADLISLTGCRVIAPDYPLAPEAYYSDAEVFLDKMLASLGETVSGFPSAGKNILMGDSAGGGLALSLAMRLRDQGTSFVDSIILLSPWLDVGMDNPAIQKAAPFDVLLSSHALKAAGSLWARDIASDDWRISPIFGSLENLPEIHLFTGTHDILNPDARLLYRKLEESGNNFTYYEYPGMIHDWMLFRMPETSDCRSRIYEILNTINE